ncbi:HAD family hydrolase [Cryobacterium sp. CG_9.6]|uniref:HAD family hydrolase n=1 Tax=Cryobacterium sp. CG_9.6 TaxID=2760710 RepID=UPI0024759024|nr:HAD family hydrolase [Cryobacterium sp. CG_9.6]MDH6236982.1 HAD superfamily hydrolase (TIGR01509 family) [Cryobacterium sp. CG_9.6]
MSEFQNVSPLPAAVLWDMDGTLVDTEPYWMRAETELVASYGGVWTHEDCMLLVGSGLWNSAGILQARGVDMEADAIVQWLTDRVQEQLAEHGVPWRPGSRELLAQLKAAGIPTALVTMSVKRMARQIVDLIDFPAFDLIIAGDMVTNSKPHPEPYLTAAATLGVDPTHCVAIEDSTPGVASAVAAGTITIAVPHQIDLPESSEYTRWSTLDGHTLADVSALYSARLTEIELDLTPTRTH